MAIEIASKCFRYLKVSGENTSMCEVLSFRKSENFLANRDLQKEIESPYEKAKKAIVPPKIRCLPVKGQKGELTLVKHELWNHGFLSAFGSAVHQCHKKFSGNQGSVSCSVK